MLQTVTILLLSTMLFAQNSNLKQVDKISKLDEFINRHIKKNLDILSHNPDFQDSTEVDLYNYFLSSKTGKFIARYRK